MWITFNQFIKEVFLKLLMIFFFDNLIILIIVFYSSIALWVVVWKVVGSWVVFDICQAKIKMKQSLTSQLGRNAFEIIIVKVEQSQPVSQCHTASIKSMASPPQLCFSGLKLFNWPFLLWISLFISPDWFSIIWTLSATFPLLLRQGRNLPGFPHSVANWIELNWI